MSLAAFLAIAACNKSDQSASKAADSAGGAVTNRDTTSKKAALAAVPPAVDAVGTYGEDLYDAVKAGNWKEARKLLDSLSSAAKQLPADVPGDKKNTFTTMVDSLNNFVAAKQREKAQIAANRVTFVSADLMRPYAHNTPVEVLLLDYEGRELEIWAAAKNMDKLNTTKSDIRRIWNDLRVTVKGKSPSQESHTETLVARIEAAKTPAELKKLATPFLDEVDNLEKVFTNQ